MTITPNSINSKDLTNADTGSKDITWDEATMTWDEATGTWNIPGAPITKGSLNSNNLSNAAQ